MFTPSERFVGFLLENPQTVRKGGTLSKTHQFLLILHQNPTNRSEGVKIETLIFCLGPMGPQGGPNGALKHFQSAIFTPLERFVGFWIQLAHVIRVNGVQGTQDSAFSKGL